MKSLLCAFGLLTLVSVSTQAQMPHGPERDEKIKSLFNVVKKASKGALDANSYQTPEGRITVMQNGTIISPPKNNLLTVAFRNRTAEELGRLDFFVGNRYGSNYFDLHNAFQATPEERSLKLFNLNPMALLKKTEAKALAFSMAKHQMLELFYMQNSPTSTLTKSYNQRGVADADHELKFYRLMSEYLAWNVRDQADYLIYIQFQKRSGMIPGKNTVSLSVVRKLVSDISLRLDGYLSSDKASEFRRLRNSIHNGMTKEILGQLAKYYEQNGSNMRSEDVQGYKQLVQLIQSYYEIDKEALTVILPKVKEQLPEAVRAIEALRRSGNSISTLVELSDLAVSARRKFEPTRNIDLTHFIIRLEEFILSELGKMSLRSAEDLTQQAIVALNLSYVTGLISETSRATLVDLMVQNPEAGILSLSNAMGQSVMLFETAFQPALTDWKLVSTSVDSYVDEGIRSSSLITLDMTLTQLKQLYPNAAKGTDDFSIENAGVGYGYLTFIPRGKTDDLVKMLTFKMIPVFEALPLDLGVVAGVITEEAQTPLSHVNIKSKNRGTPNVYIKRASQDPRVKNLLAKKALVRFELSQGVMTLREATLAEAEAFWSARNNNQPAIQLRADLNERRIRPTWELGFHDVISVGAKAANYAEATHVLPEGFRPGFGVPFYYYREFMRTNMWSANQNLEQYVTQLLNDPRIKTDRQYLVDSLAEVQKKMKDPSMIVNPELMFEIKSKINSVYPNTRMRFRSSTNSEDMPQFTGAGLYDSEAYDPAKPKKTIQKALQLVWSSVWNLRAFDERELFKINHHDVSMAILISPAFPNEIANGVGVGRNIISPKDGPGIFLNIQLGSEAVTNPNPDLTPDQVLVLLKPDLKAKTKYTLKYLKYSSLTKTTPVLPYVEVEKIADYLLKLQAHFYPIYHPNRDNPKFALDVEFKVDTEEGTRKVHYKQARPFVGD